MENDNEDIVKFHQDKRKKHKIKLIKIFITLILMSMILLVIYGVFSKGYFLKYKEKSEVAYKVNLLENEFYEEDYLEEGTDIIANLIRSIDAEFKYNLELEEKIEYTYGYRIVARTEVKESSKTSLLYETEQELLNKSLLEGNQKKLEVIEKINIDYNQYNDQINKLLEIYELRNTSSELQLDLYIKVVEKTTGQPINKEEKVMSLQIPLATKTLEISVNEKTNLGQIQISEGRLANAEIVLTFGVLLLIAGVIVLGILIKYISDTRSAEKMYEDELKKILFDYKSYIQRIKNKVDYNDYKLVKVNTFNEFFAMREDIQSPIFMHSEKEERRTTFIMINGNMLFEFILGADLIRADLIQKSKEKENRKNEKNR